MTRFDPELPASWRERADAPDVTIYEAGRKFDPGRVMADLATGFGLHRIWLAFAWDEIQKRYRRSVLGLAWIVLSFLIFLAAIALFFGGFSSASAKAFTIYVALGYAAFTFVLANIMDGCEVFRVSGTWIKSTSMPYSIYVYRSIARSVFTFALNMLAALMVMVYLGWTPPPTSWLAVPALLVFLVNAVWVQYFFGILAARFRDVSHLMSAVTRLLFFMTPIIWVREEREGMVARIADINPLTHFLEIFRSPLIGTPARPESWWIVLAFTLVGSVAAILLAGVARRRLPLWI